MPNQNPTDPPADLESEILLQTGWWGDHLRRLDAAPWPARRPTWGQATTDWINAATDVDLLLTTGGLVRCGAGWTHPGYTDGRPRVVRCGDGRIAFRGRNTASFFFGEDHARRVHYDPIGVLAYRWLGGDVGLARRCWLLGGETVLAIAWAQLPAVVIREHGDPLVPRWLPHPDGDVVADLDDAAAVAGLLADNPACRSATANRIIVERNQLPG